MAVTRIGKLERADEWAGLKKGDAVEIEGTGLRGAAWEFCAHVRHVDTDEEWIEVVGGSKGDRKIRSFEPTRVFPPRPGGGSKKKKESQLSLTDAPRLPLR